MKTRKGIRLLLLGTAVLMIVPVVPADALNVLTRAKTIIIDADWRITGRYINEVQIAGPEDTGQIHALARQADKRAGPDADTVTEIRLPDGRRADEAMAADTPLPAGTVLRTETVVIRKFPGFAGLFADVMHVEQDTPVKTAAYQIRFPEKTTFTVCIDSDGRSRKRTVSGDDFVWSENQIKHLDIMISTAGSWDEITQRYQRLYRLRLGQELGPTDFPKNLRHVDDTASAGRKIRAVMAFLETGLDYRPGPDPAHALQPDEPALVLHRGWGDCKDFALLAAALLRQMNVETMVVLMGKPPSKRPCASLPDPFMFDHAMIGFIQNGQPVYYDPLYPGDIVPASDNNIYLHLKIFDHTDH